ncbi:MAG TPA: electron transfer flavoprotein subunit alpha/FixB family protein [Synergistales bacterium]|nr:electron transfer flavoprotein subunit alpha/FixB family protein [Synergistales bacterium]
MEKREYTGVLIFVQQTDGEVAPVSLELLGKGRELAATLGTEVTAALLGSGIDPLLPLLARYGAERIVVVDDPALETYMTEPYTRAMAAVTERFKPEILLCGATAVGRDLAPRLSARLHTGLTADCTGLEIDPQTRNLMMTRPAFGGNIMATIVCAEHRPQMATVRPGVMQRIEPLKSSQPFVERMRVEGIAEGRNVEILEVVKKMSAKKDIQEARVLVAGGRGMGGPENFAVLEELAEVLGGTVASSRASVDAGWVGKDRQVGQTGKTVRPDLYIACGISGAIQHLAGMEESGIIVAINKDPSAPIFEAADYGVVGDALKIVPMLAESIRNARARKAEV